MAKKPIKAATAKGAASRWRTVAEWLGRGWRPARTPAARLGHVQEREGLRGERLRQPAHERPRQQSLRLLSGGVG